nr:protein COBRA-like [Ipomoea batatas]
MTYCVVLVAFLLSCFSFTSTDAYDPFDPYGNITIKTDVLSSTPDGYVVSPGKLQLSYIDLKSVINTHMEVSN